MKLLLGLVAIWIHMKQSIGPALQPAFSTYGPVITSAVSLLREPNIANHTLGTTCCWRHNGSVPYVYHGTSARHKPGVTGAVWRGLLYELRLGPRL